MKTTERCKMIAELLADSGYVYRGQRKTKVDT